MSCVGNLPGCLYLKTQLAVDLDVILNSKGSLFEEKVVQPHNKEHFVLYWSFLYFNQVILKKLV